MFFIEINPNHHISDIKNKFGINKLLNIVKNKRLLAVSVQNRFSYLYEMIYCSEFKFYTHTLQLYLISDLT